MKRTVRLSLVLGFLTGTHADADVLAGIQLLTPSGAVTQGGAFQYRLTVFNRSEQGAPASRASVSFYEGDEPVVVEVPALDEDNHNTFTLESTHELNLGFVQSVELEWLVRTNVEGVGQTFTEAYRYLVPGEPDGGLSPSLSRTRAMRRPILPC